MQSATTLARSGRLCRSILSRVRGRRAALVAFVTIATTSSSRATTTTNAQRSNDDGDMSEVRRREDGIVIQHDPYAPGMMEQYGMPGATDDEGFDPYKDTVGPGIYGGIVKRDVHTGEVVIGRQYQDHNPRPGPVYAGGGYTPTTVALHKGSEALEGLLDKYPHLKDDVSTGGARPLHMCGMSQISQHVTSVLCDRGADVEAMDTYGYRPLHRMASNNLAVGAAALLEAGANPHAMTWGGETALEIAINSDARDVVEVLEKYLER